MGSNPTRATNLGSMETFVNVTYDANELIDPKLSLRERIQKAIEMRKAFPDYATYQVICCRSTNIDTYLVNLLEEVLNELESNSK